MTKTLIQDGDTERAEKKRPGALAKQRLRTLRFYVSRYWCVKKIISRTGKLDHASRSDRQSTGQQLVEGMENQPRTASRFRGGLFLQYIQFCLVGGSGAFVDMFVIFLLADVLDWNLSLAKVLAAEVAIFNNFTWNEVWTFRGTGERRRSARLIRLGRFNLICLGGILLSVLLLNLQVYALSMNLYLANFISIVIASLWNFFLNLKFNWNARLAAIKPGKL